MAGVTLTGFVGLSLQEIKAQIEQVLKDAFGAGIDLSPQSNFGQLVGILSEREADLWALAEAVYGARIPDMASGASLDYVAGITGTVRKGGAATTATAFLTGDPTVVVSTGNVIKTTAGLRYLTTENATLAAANSYAALGDGATVTAGDFYTVDDAGTDRVYRVTTTGNVGTPKESPSGTAAVTTLATGTAVFTYVGLGTAVASATVASETLGPVPSTARTITEIATPVAGWSSAINLAEGTIGDALETDAALRLRREAELRANGAASIEAVRSAVLEVAGVVSCTVFENVSNTTDVDGVPAHAIEVVVRGGADALIAAAVFATKAAGIRAYGTTSVNVTDAEAIVHAIGFTRPAELSIWAGLTMIIDPRFYPVDGDDQVRAAVKAFGDAQRTGKNVVSSSVAAQAFQIPGVIDVTSAKIGLTDPATVETTIPVNLRQLAVFSVAQIEIATSEGVP